MKCIIVVFQLATILPLAKQWLFLYATLLDSEPLHFASKSVEETRVTVMHIKFQLISMRNAKVVNQVR